MLLLRIFFVLFFILIDLRGQDKWSHLSTDEIIHEHLSIAGHFYFLFFGLNCLKYNYILKMRLLTYFLNYFRLCKLLLLIIIKIIV